MVFNPRFVINKPIMTKINTNCLYESVGNNSTTKLAQAFVYPIHDVKQASNTMSPKSKPPPKPNSLSDAKTSISAPFSTGASYGKTLPIQLHEKYTMINPMEEIIPATAVHFTKSVFFCT